MRRALLAVLLALAGAAPAAAAPGLVEVGRFDKPVAIASPPGDLTLYVAEQGGRIEVLEAAGTLRPEPFLDVSADIVSGGERGLLGLAFAPDYASSGRFFVFVTAREPSGQVQVREYRRSAADPFRADPAPVRIALRQDHPMSNHNGGDLHFGPDGLLYAAIGDGGGSNDPANNAQNPGNFLGKIVRFGATGPANFHVGLRNPWRFGFDRQTGDLIIADVGQGAREEIDFAPRSADWWPGANWGWRCMEGSIPTPGVVPCDPADDRLPVHETDHRPVDQGGDAACSITGGVVVRDPGLPTLAGRYLFGDFCWGQLRSVVLTATGSSGERIESALAAPQVSEFAEDACGRVLVASLAGPVYRVVDGRPADCRPAEPTTPPGSGPPPGDAPPAGPPATPAATPPTCGLQVRSYDRRRRAIVLRRGLAVVVRVRSRCRVGATARVRGAGTLTARARQLVPGQRAVLRLRAGRRTRRGLLARRAAVAQITIVSTPAGGPRRQTRRRTRIVAGR